MFDEIKRDYRQRTEFEPERYELTAGTAYQFGLTRREFATGLVFVLTAAGAQQEVGPPARQGVFARLHIAPDGALTLFSGKVEIGQGSRTLLTQAAAEELRVPVGRIAVVLGDTELCPDDGGTWGSLTTPTTFPAVRKATAQIREMLLAAAPEQKDRAALDYAPLAKLATASPPREAKLTPPREWKLLGTSVRSIKGRDIVTGRQRYTCDLKMPEMMHGRVVRPDAHTAALVNFTAPDGVRTIRDGDFLGVLAPTPADAEGARSAVKAEWKAKPLVAANELAAHFKRTASEPSRGGGRYPAWNAAGDLTAGFAQAARKHEASYEIAYIAHVPLEPRAAVARWDGDRLTVWYGTQAPFVVREELARAFRVPAAKVRVIVPDTGSGFGGKHSGVAAIEAARLAREVPGKPVKVQWSRTEEFERAYFRPAGLLEVRSGVDANHKLTAWDFHNYNSGAAGVRIPYDAPHHVCAFHRSDSPLRQGSYRSLAAVANAFARETHMDELAVLGKVDPVDFRLRNIANPRLRGVLERAAERFGWAKRKGACGVAANIEKDGHIALCVEMDLKNKEPRVARMVLAADFGAVLNPAHLESQCTGALMQGIGGALFEEVRYDATRVLNASLSRYRVPRFRDVPEIAVILVNNRDETPAGAGEAPITVVAPAIGNALCAANGKRLRQLPLLRAW